MEVIFLVGHINNIKSGVFIKKKPKQTINKIQLRMISSNIRTFTCRHSLKIINKWDQYDFTI